MKKIIYILFFITAIATAQKVDVYDINDKKVNDKPIEKQEVPDTLKELPDGYYKLIEVKAYKSNNKYYFKQCWFLKQTNEVL